MHAADLEVTMHTEEVFDPPADFVAASEWSDPAIYERADADPSGWWASWAERLEWQQPWGGSHERDTDS